MAEEIFSAHLEELWAVAADPRGQWLALSGRHPGDRPGTITLLNAHGVALGKLTGHEKAVTALYSGEGDLLVSGGEDGALLVWQLPELKLGGPHVPYQGAPVQRLSLGAPITAVAYIPGEDGFLVVSAAVPADLETPASGLLLVYPRKGAHFTAEPSQRIALRTPLRSVTAARLKDVEGQEQVWIAAGGDEGLLVTYLRQPDGAFAQWRDLTAPTSADSAEGEALWSGHAGAVRALAFHPTIERLLSSGDDGTIRFWYLRGRVSYEERGDEKQRVPVLAMAFGPEGRDAKGEPVAPRLVTALQDGAVKLWQLDSRRPPKTLNPSKRPVRDIEVFRLGAESWLLTVSEDRSAALYKFNDTSSIDGGPERQLRSELERVNKELASQDANRRVVALRGFANEGDPEIKSIAIRLLSGDPALEVRVAAAEILGQRGDQEARKELRRALRDAEDRVRRAALFALRKLDGEGAVAPLEDALAVQHADLRREAIALLPALASQGTEARVKVRELLANGLKDDDAEVRRRALDALISLEGDGGIARALSTALDLGRNDVKLEAMRRAYRAKAAQEEVLLSALLRGLEASDADVRRLSFYVALSSRSALEAAIVQVDDRARRAFGELQAPPPEKQGEQAAPASARVPKPKLGDRARVARGERIDLEGIVSALDGEKAKLRVAGQEWEVSAADLDLVAPASALEAPPADELVTKVRATLRPQDYSPLVSALAAKQVESALLASRTLARLRDVRALGTLLQLTREKEAKNRFDVVLALRDLGDARARERLSAMLNDDDREVRLLVLDALDKLPGATPQSVAKAGLASKHADIHLHALQRLLPPVGTPLDEESRGILLTGLGAQSGERVRAEAFLILWAAAQRPETEAAGTPRRLVAERAMNSAHAEIRRLAVRAAAQFAVEGWAAALLGDAVDDADAVVQREAWNCLIAEAREHNRAAPLQAAVASRFAAILAWFNDADKDKRDLAYDALWFSYPDAPEEPLRLASRSRFPAVRLRALETARRYADDAWGFDLLRQGLDDEDEEVRNRAYSLLRDHKGPKDPDAPSVGLSSRRADIRALAALHLGGVGERGPEVEPLLLRALRDEDHRVRQNAYEALKALSKQGNLDVDSVRLGLDSFYVDLRRYALEDIERMKPEERERRRGDLYRLLGDEKEEVRQLAYQILRRHAGADDLEPLRVALTSPHRDLREPALKALKDLDAAKLARVQDVLTTHLNDENPKLRSQAYEAIVRAYGAGHLEPMKLALASPWPELREFAARDLAQASLPAAAESLLTQAMGDSVEEVRRVAFRSALTLAVGKPPKTDETTEEEATRLGALSAEKRGALSRVLGAALRSPYWDLKLLAARQLSLLRDDRSLIPMAELLLDPVEGKKQERRSQAVEILSRLEDPRAGLILQQLLDDPASDVRLRVVDGLAASTRSGKIEALREALARALKDKDQKVRTHAYQALSKESSVPREFLLPLALSSGFVDLRQRAAEDIGKLDASEAAPLRQPLSERLGDDDPKVRLNALSSLRRIAGQDDEQVLLGALASAYWDIKLEAASALAERGDRRALGPLVDLLSDPQASQNREGCLKALDALGKLGDRRASLIVQRLLRRSDRDLQIAAVRALEACCRPGEVEPLLEALRLPDETVQIAAAESLARFGDPRGMQVFAKTLQSKDVNVRRQVFRSYVALGLLGLRPIIDLTGDPDELLRRDALSVLVSYLYSTITKSGELGQLSEDELRDVKTRFATAERGDLRFAAARIFEVESSPVAFYDLAVRQLLPTPVGRDVLATLEDPEAPEAEELKLTETAELSPEELQKREQERRQKRYRAIVSEAEKLLQKLNDADPQVRAAAAQGASRLALSEGAEAFLELAERSRTALRQWMMKGLEKQFSDAFGEDGVKFLLSLLDEVDSVDARQRKLEKAMNLGRALDELEKRRLEERARREFEAEAKKRHELLGLFFERLEQIFTDYSALAEDGKDPLDDLLLRTARGDWDEVLTASRSPKEDGGRKLYLSVIKALSFPDPEVAALDAEQEKDLKSRLQAEYDAKRQDSAKAMKAKAAEEERAALAKGGRFLVLMLAMLFRIREEREKAKDRERAAYLLAALTHSDPKVRQSAIEPLSQRQNREAFRQAADAFVKRVRRMTDEERAKEAKKGQVIEVLPELAPLGWPALRGTRLEEEVFVELSAERYVTFWRDDNKKDIESWRFERYVKIVREKFEKVTEPERLAELDPARPAPGDEAVGSEMWRELAFGTYVGLLRPTADVTPKVREAVAQRIGVMARAGLASAELSSAPLKNGLADPSEPVRKAALEALSKIFNPLRALGLGLASEHPDMGLYALSRLRRFGMKLESTTPEPETPLSAPVGAPIQAVRRFEFIDGSSAKFWEASVVGKTFVVSYGRIGTAGQRKEKEFENEAEARKEHDKKVAEKLREGYTEVTGLPVAPVARTTPKKAVRRWVVVDASGRDAARALVISALDNAHPRVRRRAQELLSEFYAEGSLEPIREQVHAPRADVRDRVLADLLSRDVKDPKKHAEIISGLALALESPHEGLRLDAASALAKRLPLPADAQRGLVVLETRAAIDLPAGELARVSAAVLGTLSKLLSSHQESTQRRAAQALASLGSIDAVSALAVRVEHDPSKTAAVNPIFEAIARLARGGRLATEAAKAQREAAERPLLRELDSQGDVRRKLAYEALLSISGRPLLPEKAGETRENTGVHQQGLALRYLSAAARTRFDDVRLDAIARLHRLRDEAGYQVLAVLLLSASDGVRAASLRSLGEVWISGGSPRWLLDTLSTPSAIEGVNATKVEIAALLSSPAAWAKEHKLAAPAPARFEAVDHERIFETLAVSGLNSTIEAVRVKAMRALGALGDPRSLQLARLHLPDSLQIFEQPLQQAIEAKRLSPLRAAAAEASAELLDRAGIDAKLRGDLLRRLVILLRDTTPSVRSAAFFALGQHLDDRILALLDAALLNPQVRRLDPLVLRAPEGEGVEVTLSHDELFAVRAVAAKTVAARRYGASHVRERLAELMRDNDPASRQAAANALKALAGEDTEEFLLAAYKSPHADLRIPAIQGLIDGGRPSVAMKLLGESKERVTELLMRLLRRDPALLAQEAAQVLEDKAAPASQGAVAAQVLGALSAELRTSTPAWASKATSALSAALSRCSEVWLEAARTAERPGLDDNERKSATERARGAGVLFEATATAFLSFVDAGHTSDARLASGAAKWLLLEGPRNLPPARAVALRAIKSSRLSTQAPEWAEVQKAIVVGLGSVDPELRRLAAQAQARLSPAAGLSAKPSDALAAGQLVAAYIGAAPGQDVKSALLSRFSEADGVAAVLPALLQSHDVDLLLGFLKDTRGRGVRDPNRDTDRASKAIHRRRLAAVRALSTQRELAGNAAILALLSEIAKDRVEPEELRNVAKLAARRLRKWKKPAQPTAAE